MRVREACVAIGGGTTLRAQVLEDAMIAEKIKKFLDDNKVKYVTITHSAAYTANDIAHAAHVSGREMAKTVMVDADGRLVMAVLPASKRLSFVEAARVVGGKNVRLAHEYEFGAQFPGCETGAMPPFGNLYGVDVYVDPSLCADEEIVFNAGTHTELIRMRYDDFERLVHPKIASLAAV
jgi:Ala-tRNA(Pro) deacylase